MHSVGRDSVPNDNCRRTFEGDRIHWRSDPAQRGNPFHVTWTPDDCSWKEESAMDVRGTLVKPGMHWYLPGRDAGMYYVANIFEMEGTILDRRVRGMIGFDPIYMYEGGEIYRTRDALVQEKLELVWYTWATRYKDGSIDFGHFTLGHDMFGFAILGNEKGRGPLYATTSPAKSTSAPTATGRRASDTPPSANSGNSCPIRRGVWSGSARSRIHRSMAAGDASVTRANRTCGSRGAKRRRATVRARSIDSPDSERAWARTFGNTSSRRRAQIRCGAQRPVNRGGRFSRNAFAASPKSSEFCSVD